MVSPALTLLATIWSSWEMLHASKYLLGKMAPYNNPTGLEETVRVN